MDKKEFITICTATYNRGNLLPTLFRSLKKQTFSNFEWVIIDDGSIDNTENLVKQFKSEASFPIIYNKQKNQGKHVAINKGVVLASGSYFFIVDSDDRLPKNSLSIINKKILRVHTDSKIAGVVGLKCFFDKKIVGSSHLTQDIICDVFEYRYTHNIVGDRAEVIKTAILKDFPFPKFGTEKFLPESLVWNRIGKHYKMLFFNENVYECEYRSDGLSAQSVYLRRKYPQGVLNLYSELGQIKKIGLVNRVKAFINYWRFYYCVSQDRKKNLKLLNGNFSVFLYFPLGFFFFISDSLTYRKSHL